MKNIIIPILSFLLLYPQLATAYSAHSPLNSNTGDLLVLDVDLTVKSGKQRLFIMLDPVEGTFECPMKSTIHSIQIIKVNNQHIKTKFYCGTNTSIGIKFTYVEFVSDAGHDFVVKAFKENEWVEIEIENLKYLVPRESFTNVWITDYNGAL